MRDIGCKFHTGWKYMPLQPDDPQGRILLRQLENRFKCSSVLMDKAYEGNATRSLVESLGMTPVVPPKSNRRKPLKYDKTLYKRRNEAKSFSVVRIKSYRRVFTRYDKLDVMYLAFVHLTIICQWLRQLV